ncbi:MAG: hypothetical protein A2X25_00685 [Chloroflexi bacterium GWB2_49_20]|nr:MAG: hypothetical protein A2X25_00685 [Chloroflexi bacterium GWB2_49_20]OGN80192.1 MAG: hypothetical protein A2X26_09540 [Chloroflexi bacterium GWC2_49_37]OGN83165.1 MAG: hypothetical protein A2X27_13300 [Chloroflexi bacterium GWD2_49_16]
MTHDVFISYSSKDKPIADGICANLEASGIRCWVAPRDIGPGEEWPRAITNAITKSQVMVLVFSSQSNSSSDVGREIVLAANHKLIIIPFKIENIEPEPGKQYYLAQTHWLEAMNPPTAEQIQKLVERVRAIVPPLDSNANVQPVLVPAPIIEQPPTPSPVVKKNWFHPEYLWIGIALLLIILAVAFWPKIQGMLASPTATPTLAATDIPLPTSTISRAATATETLMPSATPTTGTLTGSVVVWGGQPYEGVTVTLCSEWTFACKGLAYSAVTDTQGSFTISGIDPGTYHMITLVPEQLGIIYPGEDLRQIQVNAGETIELDAIHKCKYDLKVSAPVVQNGKVTLHWSAYPGAPFYYLNIYDIYWNNLDFVRTPNTSVTSENSLAAGNYYYQVDINEADGVCVRAFGRFTVP